MKIREQEPMAPHTTFRIGGQAEVMYEPANKEDVEDLLNRLNGQFEDAFFLGSGSNLLIKDGRVRTPFVRLTGKFDELEFADGAVRAGGAVPMPELAMKSARSGYRGLEWASGVPGTVGGAVMMNAGAFDHETEERLLSLTVMDREGQRRTLDAGSVEFGYRFCALRGDCLVLEATFEVDAADPESAVGKTRQLIEKRREQQPVGYNSAGCVFKNGEDYAAARLIDEAGLKGTSEGNIYVSEQHANYMINRGSGRYDDVRRLIDRVKTRVLKEFDRELELELCIVDE